MKPEEQETALDEAKETPEQQQMEMESGMEQHEQPAVSEEYRSMCAEMLKEASTQELDYLEQLCSDRRKELGGDKEEQVSTDDYAKAKGEMEEEV